MNASHWASTGKEGGSSGRCFCLTLAWSGSYSCFFLLFFQSGLDFLWKRKKPSMAALWIQCLWHFALFTLCQHNNMGFQVMFGNLGTWLLLRLTWGSVFDIRFVGQELQTWLPPVRSLSSLNSQGKNCLIILNFWLLVRFCVGGQRPVQTWSKIQFPDGLCYHLATAWFSLLHQER